MKKSLIYFKVVYIYEKLEFNQKFYFQMVIHHTHNFSFGMQ